MNTATQKLSPTETLSKIMDCLKCCECGNYLFPPLSCHKSELLWGDLFPPRKPEHKLVCGRCVNKPNQMDDNIKKVLLHIEQIGALLMFPCYFTQFGCRETCLWEEAKRHERMCPFRQYKCPLIKDCSWAGPVSDLKKHCIHPHPTLEHDNSMNLDFILHAISKDMCENFLIDTIGELFVFQTKYDFRKEMFYCDVRFIGPPTRVSRFHFKIKFSYKEREYMERKQVEDDSTFDINVDTAIGIKTLLIKSMLNNTTGVFLRVEIDMRIPLYNGQPDETLMHEIECPVCKDHMIRPIRMCKSGHSLCNFCYQKLQICPTCREEFINVRNLSLESLSERMHYRCMYFNEGCNYTNIPQNLEEHEATCEISYLSCPLKELFKCEWRGKISDVCDHASKEHKFTF